MYMAHKGPRRTFMIDTMVHDVVDEIGAENYERFNNLSAKGMVVNRVGSVLFSYPSRRGAGDGEQERWRKLGQ